VHVSDVEGSLTRLTTFIERAPGVALDDCGGIVVDDDTVFVFGGDAVDRGPRSRAVVRLLLAAKERQPDRVVLLGGNRDINKLRILRELKGAVPKKAPPEVRALVETNAPELLRWILSHTMGAQPAFEFRRDELRADGAAHGDDDVVASFVADLVPPDGLHFRFLAQAQLAYRFGATLFVHGGFADEALGYVPGRAREDDLDRWVASLNAFYREQLGHYAARPIVVDEEPDWLDLVLYQAPKRGLGRNPESVVYGRFGSDQWNNPRLPSSSAMTWLARRGVARVVVGHTPCGDVPAVMRGTEGVEIVIADNSRARVEQGVVVGVEHAAADGDDVLLIDAWTRLDDGSDHHLRYRLPRAADTDVGKVTTDGHLIKGFLVDGRALLFRSDEAYALRQTALPREELGVLVPAIDDEAAGGT
jgi:hypothetical protein